MQRTQIMLDDHLLELARRHAQRTGMSLSAVVREALARWLAEAPPDVSWMGSVSINPDASDRWEDVQASIARGMGRGR